MKKLKLNKKGLTLCEVLVALAIFSIMSLLLATIVAATTQMNIKNYKMSKEMQAQGEIVEKEDRSSTTGSEEKDIEFQINGKDFKYRIQKYDTGGGAEYSNFKYFD